MTVALSPIDKLRKELRQTREELAEVAKRLKASTERNTELYEENERLKQQIRDAAAKLHLSGDEFKIYNAPGVCSFCGSFTCDGGCFK